MNIRVCNTLYTELKRISYRVYSRWYRWNVIARDVSYFVSPLKLNSCKQTDLARAVAVNMKWKCLLISSENDSSINIISSARSIAFIIAMLFDVSGARCRLSYLLNVSKTSNIDRTRGLLFSILPSSGRSNYFSGLPRLCSACRFTSEVATSIS